MGRTVPSITGVFYYELATLSQFKRALRRSDQLVFDELFANANLLLAVEGYHQQEGQCGKGQRLANHWHAAQDFNC